VNFIKISNPGFLPANFVQDHVRFNPGFLLANFVQDHVCFDPGFLLANFGRWWLFCARILPGMQSSHSGLLERGLLVVREGKKRFEGSLEGRGAGSTFGTREEVA